MNWTDVIKEIDRFQVLIAGALAIVAAFIAYRGALRQAQAVVDAEVRRTAEDRRAVAAALWAELCNVGTRLFADSQRLLATPVRDGRLLGLEPIDLSVFQADPSAVGRMPSDEAFMVTQVYKLLADVNRRYAKLNASSGIDDQVANSTGLWLGGIIEQIRVTLRGLRETAGLPEDKARAAMTPWTPIEEP